MTNDLAHDKLGRILLNLCRSAENEVLLVAPFFKNEALKRLLAVVPDHVSLRCVTRWHPSEIATGASDIDVWLTLKSRPLSSLYLRQDLHAKYYRVDDRCVTGSANLTLSALGWSSAPNLEILYLHDQFGHSETIFEIELFSKVILVTNDIYARTSRLAEELSRYWKYDLHGEMLQDPVDVDETDYPEADLVYHLWIPKLRHPEDLFLAYSGADARLTKVAQISAHSDLRFLHIPRGLDKEVFEHFVAVMLFQQPIVQQLDTFFDRPRRFGAVTDYLEKVFKNNPDFDADLAWQTLMRWMLYFLPKRYTMSVPNYSEVFYKVEDTT